MKICYVSMLALGLTACGAGANDPSAYSATAPGTGSSVVSAETAVTQGTIKYGQYRATDVALSIPAWSQPSVSATVDFSPTSRQGAIRFPVADATETVSTSDGYANLTWTGPFSYGAYRFHGNILMGCDEAVPSVGEMTQVFVSSSLKRVQNGDLDDLSGISFDVFDCTSLKQGSAGTAKISTDGSLSLSIANTTFPKNQVFDLLNPERYPGVLVNDGNFHTTGFYSGHAYRYDADNVTRYAIVIQTDAGSLTPTNRYHYYLAVQH